VEGLSSDERPPELLNVFPLNVAPLLPLPNERVERSELGIWIDWLLRELEFRDESLLDDMLREDDDPLLPLLFDERPPWLDRSFLSSLSRATAKLAVRKTDRRPAVAKHMNTRLRRIWGTFLLGRLSRRPRYPDLLTARRNAAARCDIGRTLPRHRPTDHVLGKPSRMARATLQATGCCP
jgi:hypothetical protein